jgi:phosphoglycolate phosphatase-like HAD superfamily hydrolase
MRERDGRLMPGFPELLDALSREPGVRIGLATGNFAEAARLKLEHFGISQYFSGGGFGEVSHERAEVVAAAIAAVAPDADPVDVLVIGDTPRDVSSALANGVVAVGVATGSYRVDALRESGAHLAYEDFSNWAAAAEQMLAFSLA